VSVEIGIEVHLLIEFDQDETIPCEHSQHDILPAHHEDGNEHYIRSVSPCGHGNGDVFVVCEKWLKTSDMLGCNDCPQRFHISEGVVDLGLVSDFHR
jgi:hypothetical protein